MTAVSGAVGSPAEVLAVHSVEAGLPAPEVVEIIIERDGERGGPNGFIVTLSDNAVGDDLVGLAPRKPNFLGNFAGRRFELAYCAALNRWQVQSRAGAGPSVSTFAYVHQVAADDWQIWLNGACYTLGVSAREPKAMQALGASGSSRASNLASLSQPEALRVLAPMPGKLLQLNVAPGDEVVAGQIVAVMTSMKMEISLPAPGAGRVAEVNCTADDQVKAQQLLIRLEPVS
ncbi:MAG: biotin/lipoyl-containing protein [Vampirovibrionales bacterium]|nr:biotin/lipoyl-containing protein [Vampirovibrionales bacterium]